MFLALGWLVVVVLVALWSLTAWALHAVAVWTVSSAGALSGTLRVPEWLAPWVPAEIVSLWTALIVDLGPVVDGVLQAMPALTGGVTLLAWVVWGIGSAALVGLGAALHVAIALWSRRSTATPPQAERRWAAG